MSEGRTIDCGADGNFSDFNRFPPDFHLISTCVLEVSPTNKTGHEQKQRRSLEKGLRSELIGHVTPAALSLIRNPRPGFSLKKGSLT